jgi:hypothetical protein
VEFQTSAVSHARTHVKISTTPREPSESPSKSLPNPNSRLFCNGWRPKPRHDGRQRGGASAPPARLPARPPGQTGQDGAQARTAALEVGSTRDTRFCKQVRAPIRSVTHLWADIVAHATRATRTPFHDAFSRAFRKSVRCVGQTHSLIGHLEHNSWRPLRQGSLGQPTAALRPLRACILCFAARGSFKSSGLTSRLAKVV